MSARTWTREPIAPEEGVGMVYQRGDYRVQRLGKDYGWTVWRGEDFLGPAQRLAEGKALTWRDEIGRAWLDAGYENRARRLTDWNLQQALGGATVRRQERVAAIYRAEIERRQAARTQVEERGRTQYTMHAYRAPFSGQVFNHIMPPAGHCTMCRALHGGPGEPLDLAEVDCLACVDAYTEALLAGVSPFTKEKA